MSLRIVKSFFRNTKKGTIAVVSTNPVKRAGDAVAAKARAMQKANIAGIKKTLHPNKKRP